MEATALRFARAARVLAEPTRRRHLLVPGFRSPPRLPGADRSLQRRPGGSVVVSVRIRGRPWQAVLSDMVEGVVVANRLPGTDADSLRRELWGVLDSSDLLPPTEPIPAPRPRHLSIAHDPRAA